MKLAKFLLLAPLALLPIGKTYAEDGVVELTTKVDIGFGAEATVKAEIRGKNIEITKKGIVVRERPIKEIRPPKPILRKPVAPEIPPAIPQPIGNSHSGGGGNGKSGKFEKLIIEDKKAEQDPV